MRNPRAERAMMAKPCPLKLRIVRQLRTAIQNPRINSRAVDPMQYIRNMGIS